MVAAFSSADLSALYEIGDPLEDICHLPHDSEPLLHELEELLVFLWSRRRSCRRGDVVVILERALVALDSHRILLPLQWCVTFIRLVRKCRY